MRVGTGLVAFKIDKGYCEEVRLDDLAVVATFYCPRAIHDGPGVLEPILDEPADALWSIPTTNISRSSAVSDSIGRSARVAGMQMNRYGVSRVCRRREARR